MFVDRGFALTCRAVRRQLAAMPCLCYQIRLIHGATHAALPGERLWTAAQILRAATLGFLRARNREGYDIYFRPDAGDHNAGYILVDLDGVHPAVLPQMCAAGHHPCVALQSSPGNLQAWVHVSATPLPAAWATALGKHLARQYHGDPASTDWRHLGRLAGFTNRKPARCRPGQAPPWVQLCFCRPGQARSAAALLDTVCHPLPVAERRSGLCTPTPLARITPPHPLRLATPTTRTPGAAAPYHHCLQRLRILQRFPSPDWSIVDLWVAQQLLREGTPPAQIQAILRAGSPGFPRAHPAPEDYLRRTLARASAR